MLLFLCVLLWEMFHERYFHVREGTFFAIWFISVDQHPKWIISLTPRRSATLRDASATLPRRREKARDVPRRFRDASANLSKSTTFRPRDLGNHCFCYLRDAFVRRNDAFNRQKSPATLRDASATLARRLCCFWVKLTMLPAKSVFQRNVFLSSGRQSFCQFCLPAMFFIVRHG